MICSVEFYVIFEEEANLLSFKVKEREITRPKPKVSVLM